eukprot:296410_1
MCPHTNQLLHMWLLYLLFGVSYVLSPISSIPLTDLSERYPTDFQVDAYACAGHFWFQYQWTNGQRKYVMDPPFSSTDDRWIIWADRHGTEDLKWWCYKPQNDIYWASCSDTNIFNCNSGIVVRYEITASQSSGWYQQLGIDQYGFNYYQTVLDTPYRFIAYDKDSELWLVTDGVSTLYDTCSAVNFFECPWVQTGQTAAPTLSLAPSSSSSSPTYVSVSPTAVSFSPSEAPFKVQTEVPTHVPTDITTPPTKKPSLYAEIPSKTSTKSPSYSLAIASTNILTQAVDVNVGNDLPTDNRDGIRTILLVFINAMICILCGCGLYLANAIYKHKTSNKAAIAMDGDPSLIMNARPVIHLQPMERDRVPSHSVFVDDDNDMKVNEHVVQISDVSEEPIQEKVQEPWVQATDPGIQIDERMKIRQEKQREQLEQWLTNSVKLAKYYELFVQNGYDSLAIIKEIADVDELAEIGIELKGHKIKIMKEIERLVLVEDFVE